MNYLIKYAYTKQFCVVCFTNNWYKTELFTFSFIPLGTSICYFPIEKLSLSCLDLSAFSILSGPLSFLYPVWTSHPTPVWTSHPTSVWTSHPTPVWTSHPTPVWTSHPMHSCLYHSSHLWLSSIILILSFCKAPVFVWLDERRCRLKGKLGFWCHSYEHSYV